MASVLHVPVRKTMKKDSDHSNSIEKVIMSRPSSGSSVSSKASSQKSKDKVKDRGPSKEEMVRANEELSTEIENLAAENQLLKTTVGAVIDTLIENAKIKGIKIPTEIENPHVTEIPMGTLVSFAESLTAEPPKTNTMEFRVEELETRITHLNTELAKLLRTRMTVENGLDKILNDCDISLDDIKKKTRHLLREIRSTSLFTFVDLPPVENRTSHSEVTQLDLSQCSESTTAKTQKTRNVVVLTTENLNLTPPTVKLPGDTHIKKMHKDLRQYVIQQLSLPKGNGTDWRMMGERLGIPAETINQWKRWKVDQPMYYVLQTWSQSTGATVRILHRHLVSPQMKCTLLAKRISDFYKVD